ncbi:alkaline phosphatase family protein [bacterium]|nr:alkaline phosphatase family protein [bacterium]
MIFRKRKSSKKVFVLSLDGTPFTFLDKLISEGLMPNFKSLLEIGSMRRMHSVIPPISSVAWSSFMTGKNPAKHGIFGFVDRNPNPMEMLIPTGKDIRTETLWEYISSHGKKVIVMNVPETYPPRKVNGILISGFLASEIDNAVYPSREVKTFKDRGYVIDADSGKARENKSELMHDLFFILEKRMEVARYLYKNRDWDFFMCHIMETDRINHFYWKDYEENGEYHDHFLRFYQQIDRIIGGVIEDIGEEVSLLLLSDHGFCGIKSEVQPNKLLLDNGLLQFKSIPPQRGLLDIAPETRIYSLIPGRFYVNLKGREEHGTVNPGTEYEEVIEQTIELMTNLKDPEGMPVVNKCYRKEEVYSGDLMDQAPDMVVLPVDGYDFKGQLYPESLFGHTHLQGMHTYDDAFMYIRNKAFKAIDPIYVYDGFATILHLMDIPLPGNLDSRIIV